MDDAGAVFRRAREIVASAGLCAASYSSLSDSELLDTQALIARLSAHVQQQAALSAAELARRSERSLGQSGLAARMGHATPGALVQTIMGGSKAEAATLLNSGLMLARTQAADDAARMLAEHEELTAGGDGQGADRPNFPPVPAEAAIRPWFAPISDAAAVGRFSLSVAESIRSGWGQTRAVSCPSLPRSPRRSARCCPS